MQFILMELLLFLHYQKIKIKRYTYESFKILKKIYRIIPLRSFFVYYFFPCSFKNFFKTIKGLYYCGSITYNPNQFTCCNGQLTLGSGLLCCNTQAYNPNQFVCTNGILTSLIPSNFFCGSSSFNPNQFTCCSGVLNVGGYQACCGTKAFNSNF